jgi:hypothetical protein
LLKNMFDPAVEVRHLIINLCFFYLGFSLLVYSRCSLCLCLTD